eukprot:389523-Amphidinium_carterae.1
MVNWREPKLLVAIELIRLQRKQRGGVNSKLVGITHSDSISQRNCRKSLRVARFAEIQSASFLFEFDGNMLGMIFRVPSIDVLLVHELLPGLLSEGM